MRERTVCQVHLAGRTRRQVIARFTVGDLIVSKRGSIAPGLQVFTRGIVQVVCGWAFYLIACDWTRIRDVGNFLRNTINARGEGISKIV